MANRKPVLFLILIALFAACSKNQPCTVQLEQSPELRGFRLGMSVADIRQRFNGFPTPEADDLGVATVEISNMYSSASPARRSGDVVLNFVNATPYAELNQLKHAELKLLDGRLVEITVYYPNDLNWSSADEFAKKT